MGRIERFSSALVILALCVFVIGPRVSLAVQEEANEQCPEGGNVGDPCKDNTNGYQTTGHCVYIHWCKADNYKQPPPSGGGGSGGGGSAVSTPPSPTKTPTDFYVNTRPFSPSSSEVPVTDGSVTVKNWSVKQVVQVAYAQAQPAPYSSSGQDSYLKYLDFNGSKYMVTPDAILQIGSRLSAAGSAPSIPSSFDTEAFKSVASLTPEMAADMQQATYSVGVNTQSSSPDYAEDGTFIGNTSQQGSGNSGSGRYLGLGNALTPKKLSDVAIALSVLAVLIGMPAYFIVRVIRKGRRPLTEASKIDATVLAKNLSTKDASVAAPLVEGSQEKVIWDKRAG